jgi:hypothetical protein
MCRRSCPVLLVALAVGLVLTRRRLSSAQDELRLLRVAARAQDRRISEVERTSDAAVAMSRAPAAVSAESPAEDFSEWEQAVPPMDS